MYCLKSVAILAVILFVSQVGALDDCFMDDFRGNLGILSAGCDIGEPFMIKAYEDNEDELFMRPENSVGDFIATDSRNAYCIRSEIFTFYAGTQISFLYFARSNPSNTALLLTTFAGSYPQVIIVDNSQTWKEYKWNITSTTTGRIQLLYSSPLEDASVAIDFIKILAPNTEDCYIVTPTTTTTTDQPTTSSDTTVSEIEPTVTSTLPDTTTTSPCICDTKTPVVAEVPKTSTFFRLLKLANVS